MSIFQFVVNPHIHAKWKYDNSKLIQDWGRATPTISQCWNRNMRRSMVKLTSNSQTSCYLMLLVGVVIDKINIYAVLH